MNINFKLSESFKNRSVSEATLITEDILARVIWFLDNYVPENALINVSGNIEEAREILKYFRTHREISDEKQEEIAVLLNEDMWSIMDAIAPEGCGFSSHPGDGADFGFWENEEG